MKKFLTTILALTLCLGLATVSLAIVQPRYTDIASILGSARALSSTKIRCSATLNAYEAQNLEIEIIVTDQNGDEIFGTVTSDYDDILTLSKDITVKAGGVYTCEFFFTCGADSPVVTRTVRT